jgi:protease I
MTYTKNKTVAILATDGFEQIELTSPREAIESAGAQTRIVSTDDGTIQGNEHRQHGDDFKVDITLAEANAGDFDALLIPGGLFNPDALRVNEDALNFVKAFFEQQKPVFSICHGPQVLISADLVKGRKITGFSAIQRDLQNAGGLVEDTEVVVDDGLVTSRNPNDLEAFNAQIVDLLNQDKQGHHGRSLAA